MFPFLCNVMRTPSKKLGILGGTFNPPHYGHLQLANIALKQVALDSVIWVPNRAPPYRSNPDPDLTGHRLVMVQRAIASYPQFQLSTVDLDRPGPSYAIYTLRDLDQQYPGSTWYWILGMDAFRRLPQWYGSTELVARCTWLVAPRADRLLPDISPQRSPLMSPLHQELEIPQFPQGVAVSWQRLLMPPLNISSSLIRQRCRDRQPIDDLVPPVIKDYLSTQQLYSAPDCEV
jgi:nicotinate-nucleotide adenylyltransferase